MIVQPFLLRLMHARPFRSKFGPEDVLVMGMAADLRAWTLEGRLRAVWTKIQAEAAWVADHRPEAGRARMRQAKGKAMGAITGAWEFIFTWQGGSGWIEAKSTTGALTPEQKDFRDWLDLCGVQRAIVRRPGELEAVLREWQVLR